MANDGRIYMGCPGHFIGGRSCVFHLSTYLPTGFIVSTVGDYRPNDEGPEEIGLGRLFETMVFKAVPGESKCCLWQQESGEDLDFAGYNDRDAAAEGHEAMCRKWESPQ